MKKIIALRMERQHLIQKADEAAYLSLYKDLQPGQNVYWNGFGDPPSLTFRANFNDIALNRRRQAKHEIMKGRFAGGNLGWVMHEDFELFACAFCKPLGEMSERQRSLLTLIEREGPMNIQQMKEATGMLVKEITPVLHRLQEAFLIYEDQYDGEWDRGWYTFAEIFPDANLARYTKPEALKILLQRFAYRHVWFDFDMAKSFYKLPIKVIRTAIEMLLADCILEKVAHGWMLKTDIEFLDAYDGEPPKFVYAMHRNDFLVRSNEHWLKDRFKHAEYDTLQYLLIDGAFRGAIVGHFRNGPYDLEDVILDLLPEEERGRKTEILEAVRIVNYGSCVKRYQGSAL